jgi:uncharacterized protein YheU (UPF0270 family)
MKHDGIKIPYKQLDETTLRAVIESFVLREGTDYGDREASLDTKVEHVLRQLEKGDACIVFDKETESVSIVCPRDATFEN